MTGVRGIGKLEGWFARWGFAALVMVAAIAGLAVGTTVVIPPNLPSVALQATALYRLEVGGATFAGLYVIAMALVLALQNRAFTEIGTGGMRATSLVSKTLAAEQASLETLMHTVDRLKERQQEEGGD